MYYTVIKRDGHLITRGKCRKYESQASVFYIQGPRSTFLSGGAKLHNFFFWGGGILGNFYLISLK